MVLLIAKRKKLVTAGSTRSCKLLLTNDQASPRLAKKLLTPVRTSAGVASW
jgi:hypothetical protein